MSTTAPAVTPTYRELPLACVQESTWNPRKTFAPGPLKELADSIRQKGVIEPIIVRPIPGDRALVRDDDGVPSRLEITPGYFEVIAGARRLRAAHLAGLSKIPALVRDLDDVAALELAVIENTQRTDVPPLEEAAGYRALQQADRKFTPAVIAAKVGKSESYIYRRLKLLELEPALQDALAADRLPVAYAERLLRLPPALRAEAADPDTGVVWRSSPLLEDDDDPDVSVPGRENLRPLHELEDFIRTRSSFDPAAEETRHYQPELAEVLTEALDPDRPGGDDADDEDHDHQPTVLSLSMDTLARSQLRAKKGDPVPLTPSRWHAITSSRDQCEFTVTGVVTHGGPPRVLDVCATKRCVKHFPPAKKKPATAREVQRAAVAKREVQRAAVAKRLADEEAAKKAKAAWDQLLKVASPAFAAHVKGIKFNAALVRHVLSSWDLTSIKTDFGVVLTDSTAAQVLCLSTVLNSRWSRDRFQQAVKPYKFNLGAIIKQQLRAATKAAAKTQGRR